MPDWLSHILIALIIVELFNIKYKSLVVLGSLLPDLVTKFHLINIFRVFPQGLLDPFFVIFHTPIMVFLLALIIAPFFRLNQKLVIGLISLGWITHILSDLTNKHLLFGQSFLLFPFSWRQFEIGLFWPDQYYLVLIPLLIVYLVIKLIKFRFSIGKNLLEV